MDTTYSKRIRNIMHNLCQYIWQLRRNGKISWNTQTSEKIGNLNSLISLKEIEFGAKAFPTEKLQAQIFLLAKFSRRLRKNQYRSQNIAEGQWRSNTSQLRQWSKHYSILTQDKDYKKRTLQSNTSHDIHTKLLNKDFSKLNSKIC